MLSVEATLTYDCSPQEVRDARLASVPLSIRNRSSLTVLTFMALLFQHQAGLGRGTPRACVDGTRYDIVSLLGKRVTLVTSQSVDAIGAGVRLSRPFLGKPKSDIRQTVYRLYPSPSNVTLMKIIPRTAQRALINLAIEDAMTGEESSCKKCFP